MNTMTYKGYTAAVEFDGEDNIFVGRVVGINDIIDFMGTSVPELETDFHNAINGYLKMCKEVGKKPDKPRSGKMTLNLPPELQATLDRVTESTGQDANNIVVDLMRVALGAAKVVSAGERQAPILSKKKGKGKRREAVVSGK